MKIEVFRDILSPDFTSGRMFLDGKFYGFTLEDPVRDVKIPGATAIPEGSYKVKFTYSGHFKKNMSQLMDVPGFEGIRIHGGNTVRDTDGCILVARNRDVKKGIIWGSLSADINRRISKAKTPVEAIITKEPVCTKAK